MFKAIVSMKYIMVCLVVFTLLAGCQPAATPGSPTAPRAAGTPEIEQTEMPAEMPIEETVSESPSPTSKAEGLIPIPEINIPDYPCTPPSTITDVREVPDADGIVVDEQIILIGPQEQVDLVAEAVEPIGELLSGLGGDVQYRIVLPEDSDGISITIELHGLNLVDDQSVWDVVELTNAVADEEDLPVYAEPNYITVSPIIGSPRGGGSGIVGDPSGAGGSAVENGKTKFIRQWALIGDTSIHLIDTNEDWNIGSLSGAEIEVAVFDTVPVALQDGKQPIDWAYIPFELCVWKPGLMVTGSDAIENYQDHGLFATGLAQIVAPAAHYTLVEVLNADAVGDLFTLLQAMDLYTNDRWTSTSSSPLEDTVMNLSLGLAVEKRHSVAAALKAYPALTKLAKRLGDSQKDVPAYLRELAVDKFPVVSLATALSVFDYNGAVIVAAAGNDSKTELQAPAAFTEVIGVASSNDQKEQSCFSNYGNIAAPGGEGGGEAGACLTDLTSLCTTSALECEPLSVISLVGLYATTQITDPVGYAYWQGTSFAAPLVSGLATLVLDTGAAQSPQHVREVIYCSPGFGGAAIPTAAEPLGAGVIDVKEALTNCP